MDQPNLNQIFSNAFSHPFFQNGGNPFRGDNYQQNISNNQTYQNMQNYYFNFPNGNQEPQQNNQQQTQQQSQQQSQNQNSFQQKKKKKSKESKEQLTETSCFFWKNKGNEYFKLQEYKNAISCYTKAIVFYNIKQINDTESVFFCNRAQSYRMIQEWQLALKDSISAIELDDKNIKAYMVCGICLAQFGKYENTNQKLENALVKLTKALTLCAGQEKKEYERQLYGYILLVKKIIWLKNFSRERQYAEEQFLIAKHYTENDYNLTLKEQQEQINKVFNFNQFKIYLQKYENFKFDIPDFYCCKITFDLMQEPYITPAGNTYEGEYLMQHIEKNGSFDPLSREPFQKEMIYPNIQIKQAINQFLLENPWAYDFKQGENHMEIQL